MATYNKYEPELKEKILRLYLDEGRTKKSLTEEYNLGSGTINTGYNNDVKNAKLILSSNKKLIPTRRTNVFDANLKN